ncbi:hypothetical protein AYO22_11032 [Fonsecaea multimorphosa]|nr:hypothetical protein AYO22_11032 [Fonsecaea multimorphosa]
MTESVQKPRTLYEKVLESHIVDEKEDGTVLIYIDRHLIHEVTSPQAFDGLRSAGRQVRRPDCTLATVDHNIPTASRKNFKSVQSFVKDKNSRIQCETLQANVEEFGVPYFGFDDSRQGIVHVIGPEQGFTLPGATIVCGDSHTSTHGAFGALAFGIGTSEVEHVLATQTLWTKRSLNLSIDVQGTLHTGVTSKDLILYIIGTIGTARGTGYVIEFTGPVIQGLSMEARMSLCNMSIEAGARAGMIAPDEVTFEYLQGRPLSPKYRGAEWKKAISSWSALYSDKGAKYDLAVQIDAREIIPTVSWGSSPQDVLPITGVVPSPDDFASDEDRKKSCIRALNYMGLTPGTPLRDIQVDKTFIGSCTNSRIEDLREAAQIVSNRKVSPHIRRAIVVPGSGLVKKQAEAEGLDQVFLAAGFEWTEAGCSMCCGMNPDVVLPQERVASSSNRNFEGRQGDLARTHLMSAPMVAAAAIAGKLVDPEEQDDIGSWDRDLDNSEEPVAERPQGDIDSHTTRQSGGLPKFTTWKGIAAHMSRANVDTDVIIPTEFCKTVKKVGLGVNAFYPLRYNPRDGSERAEFVLNQGIYRESKILVVTGPNFGCGNSREHAPWALNDFGIRCIIAPSFANIFYSNAFKNGMLPITVQNATVMEELAAEARAGHELEVDLVHQNIKSELGVVLAQFEVDSFRKHCLVNGIDEISLTLLAEDKIRHFEALRTANTPWLDGRAFMKQKHRLKRNLEATPVPGVDFAPKKGGAEW